MSDRSIVVGVTSHQPDRVVRLAHRQARPVVVVPFTPAGEGPLPWEGQRWGLSTAAALGGYALGLWL